MRAFWPAAYPGAWATAQSAGVDDAKRRENAQNSNLDGGTAALRPNQAAGFPGRQETSFNVVQSCSSTCPRRLLSIHKLIISLLTMWPHSHDASSTASALSGPASTDGYKRWPPHRCAFLFYITASQQTRSNTSFPNFLISLFPFFLCGHYFLAVYAQSFKHQQQ